MNFKTNARGWNDLSDIQDTEHFLDTDTKCLDEIEGVLERYGMMSRFGVALLHKDFSIDEDEVLVERCDAKKKTLTLKPEKISDLEGQDVVPTIYRFDNGVRYGCSYCNRDHHT